MDKRSPESGVERLEDSAYESFVAALDEEERVLGEIDEVLARAVDRRAAERLILERYASRLEASQQRSREALRAWDEELKKIK